MKKILALVLALVTLLSCVSCFGGKVYEAAPADFSADGMNITLTKAFKKAKIDGYTAAFDSKAVAVFVLKESAAMFGDMADMSQREYAELLRQANASKNPDALKTEEGVLLFEYSFYNPAEKQTYKYFTTVHKSDDAFWMVQFASVEANYEEHRPYMLQWAKSINFD